MQPEAHLSQFDLPMRPSPFPRPSSVVSLPVLELVSPLTPTVHAWFPQPTFLPAKPTLFSLRLELSVTELFLLGMFSQFIHMKGFCLILATFWDTDPPSSTSKPSCQNITKILIFRII
jgi:hypothetical protein